MRKHFLIVGTFIFDQYVWFLEKIQRTGLAISIALPKNVGEVVAAKPDYLLCSFLLW